MREAAAASTPASAASAVAVVRVIVLLGPALTALPVAGIADTLDLDGDADLTFFEGLAVLVLPGLLSGVVARRYWGRVSTVAAPPGTFLYALAVPAGVAVVSAVFLPFGGGGVLFEVLLLASVVVLVNQVGVGVGWLLGGLGHTLERAAPYRLFRPDPGLDALGRRLEALSEEE